MATAIRPTLRIRSFSAAIPSSLVHNTRALLNRVLPNTSALSSSPFWSNLLDLTLSDLSSPARLVVYPLGPCPEALHLVTALLQQPFSPDFRSQPDSTPPYLAQFPIPIKFTELTSTNHSSSHPTFSNSTPPPEHDLAILFGADIPIIVCNPLTTPLTSLPSSLPHLANPNTILVLTTPPFPHLIDPIHSLLRTHPHNLTILFIDPSRALRALDALKLHSADAVQQYQHDFIGSRISTLTDALKRILARHGSITALRTHTAEAQIRGALRACREAIARAEAELSSARAGVSTLRCTLEEARAKAHRDVFHSGARDGGGDAVQNALTDAERELSALMNRLTWWRMLWRVDEIGVIVADAVERAWCKQLEQHLIFHTGILSALHQSLTSSARTLLAAQPPASPLASPLLSNTLDQLQPPRLASTPSPTTITTIRTALTAPLHTRRHQIITYPTTRLHLAAQRVVLGMGGGATAGAGLCCWAAWLGVGGVGSAGGEGVLISVDAAAAAAAGMGVGTGTGTLVAAGVLVAVGSLRWGVGTWERAKQRWWDDWRRVGNGLGRDLKAALEVTMDKVVVVVAERACDGLEDLARKREEEVEEIKEEVGQLEDALENHGKKSPGVNESAL